MAIPYTIVMTITGLLAVIYLLVPVSESYYEKGIIHHHEITAEAVEEGKKH